jgi:hypothetical protein
VGGACSAQLGDEKRMQSFTYQTRREDIASEIRHRREDNIKMDPKVYEDLEWVYWLRIGASVRLL